MKFQSETFLKGLAFQPYWSESQFCFCHSVQFLNGTLLILNIFVATDKKCNSPSSKSYRVSLFSDLLTKLLNLLEI